MMVALPIVVLTESAINLAWFRGRPLRQPILFDSPGELCSGDCAELDRGRVSIRSVMFTSGYGSRIMFFPGKRPPTVPKGCGWWKSEPEPIEHNQVQCTVPNCPTICLVEGSPTSKTRVICREHARIDTRRPLSSDRGALYAILGRDTNDKKKWIDRQYRFQDYIPRAFLTTNTSASLRWLIEPKSPPQFAEPTPEELERLCAANAEYDRRVQESYARTNQIASSYGDLEQKSLLERLLANPSAARRKNRNPLLPGSRVDRDHRLHNRIHLVAFQDRPTAEQTREWNRKVREAMRDDYRREREQADLALHSYIAELQKELRDTDDSVPRSELRQRIVELLLVEPFRVAEPKTAPEISWIETEFGDRGFTRLQAFPDEDGEDLDVFELIPGDLILPKSQKRRVRLTLERITKTYIEHTTRARQKRIERLIQEGDPNELRESKDFQKLLGSVLVLNQGLEPWQAALVMGEKKNTVKMSAGRLYQATLELEMIENENLK